MSHVEVAGLRLLAEGAAYHVKSRSVIASDLHLGYAPARPWDALPRDADARVGDALVRACGNVGAARVILAGDVIDARMPRGGGTEVARILDALASIAELVIVRGNHDTTLADVTDHPITDVLLEEDLVVIHGDRPLPRASRARSDGADTVLVTGHEHPAVTLRGASGERLRSRAFLVHEGEKRVILPALSPWTRGVDHRYTRGFYGPVHGRSDPLDFDVCLATGEDALPFGRLRDLNATVAASRVAQAPRRPRGR